MNNFLPIHMQHRPIVFDHLLGKLAMHYPNKSVILLVGGLIVNRYDSDLKGECFIIDSCRLRSP